MDTNQTTANHWAAPSAPDQAAEARYRRAVASGLSRAEFEAREAAQAEAANAALDARIERAQAQGATDADRWDAIYRAAVCAAAQAIEARNWEAKRQALAVAQQADEGRQQVIAAIFGRPREIPAQYAGLEKAGASISRAESSAALKVIAADRDAARQQRPQRGPNGRYPVCESRRRG
jgi:cytochrome P450